MTNQGFLRQLADIVAGDTSNVQLREPDDPYRVIEVPLATANELRRIASLLDRLVHAAREPKFFEFQPHGRIDCIDNVRAILEEAE